MTKMKSHGTGIPGKTYVNTFLTTCFTEVDMFKKSGSCVLTWPQKVLLENAYKELGGNAFDKTCPTCVLDVLKRLLNRTAHLHNSPQIEPDIKKQPSPVVEPRAKVYTKKFNKINHVDGTVIYHNKDTSIRRGTELFIMIDDKIMSLPKGKHELTDGRIITMDESGKIKSIENPEPEKKSTEPDIIKLDKTLDLKIEALEAMGGIIGKLGIHHKDHPETFITMKQLQEMDQPQMEHTINIYKQYNEKVAAPEVKKQSIPVNTETFVASTENTKAQLENILKQNNVKIPRKARLDVLINMVNDLKLPKTSVHL